MSYKFLLKTAGGQAKLAQLAGVSISAVAQWGRHGIPAERVPHLARELKVERWQIRPDLWDAPQTVPEAPTGDSEGAEVLTAPDGF